METAGTQPLLLLVDDEREILVALTDLLEDRYRILSTTSPVEALGLIAVHPDIAVIVSDQRMPELTGSQFLARARTATDAEAILLTGYADLSAVVAALNEGAISGYANKPWDAEALTAMIAAAAERHALRRALAFERAAFRGLADSSGDAVAILDAEGRIVRGVNDASVDARDLAALAQDRVDDEDRHQAVPGVDACPAHPLSSGKRPLPAADRAGRHRSPAGAAAPPSVGKAGGAGHVVGWYRP